MGEETLPMQMQEGVSDCVVGGRGAAGASVHAAVPACPLGFYAPLGYSLTFQQYRRACDIIIN